MATTIIIDGKSVSIVGHAETVEDCRTITGIANALKDSAEFETGRFESGYCEFKRASENNQKLFAPDTHMYIYSNDGNTLLQTITQQMFMTTEVTATGLLTDGTWADYTYSGAETFSGFAISPNATTPTYAIGDTFTIIAEGNLYIVEASGEIEIDLTSLSGWSALASGSHSITVKAKAAGYNDSVMSNAVSVTKASAAALHKYSGSIDGLSVARSLLAATTVGNYALFGGGRLGNYSASSVVDAYDTSLTRTIPAGFTWMNSSYLAATTVGNYALFGGGEWTRAVNAYDTSLTHTTPTVLVKCSSCLAATTVGNYALFGGGYDDDYEEYVSAVNAYDTSLTRTTPTALSLARGYLAAATVGNYALFGGGEGDSVTALIDAYDTSLTRTTPTALSLARGYLAAATVGNYALFGGGYTFVNREAVSVVDAYDTSLTRTIPTALSGARYILAATTVGNYALFGGGFSETVTTEVVEAYYVA